MIDDYLFLPQLFYHPIDSDSIFDYIPKEIMPTEIGGTGKSLKLLSGEYKTYYRYCFIINYVICMEKIF